MIKFYYLISLSVLIFYNLFLNCNGLINYNSKYDECQYVRVVSNLPLVSVDGKLVNETDSFDVYYFKNYTTYKFYIPKFSKNDDSTISVELSYRYFVFKKNEERGFLIQNETIDTLGVDSFLTERAFYNFDFYENFKNTLMKDSFYSRSRDTSENELNLKFISKQKGKRIDYADTIIYYLSDEWKNIDYSLSKELDNEENFKFYKLRMIFNSQFYDRYDFKFPYHEFYMVMKPIPGGNCKDVLPYIERIESLQ